MARHARGVRAGADGPACLKHSPDRRSSFCLPTAVAINKVLTLKRHPVLNRNAAAQRFYTLDVAVGDRFTMVKEPVEASKRDLAVDFLVDVQDPRDCLVVSAVQT